jgi:sugar lactone lactonase YvrE
MFAEPIRRRHDVRRTVLTALGATVLALAGGAVTTAPANAEVLPKVISLPDGFRPEGIATGPGATFYVGSLADGAIYRGSLLTGRGQVFIPGTPGGAVNGLEVSGGRLYAAGGSTGTVKSYDLRSGRLLTSTTVGGFVNDVVVTRTAAYYTNSLLPEMYVLPLRGGPVRTVPLTGDIAYGTGFNANGIEASPDGRTLLIVQSNTGLLFRVTPTGVTRQVDLGGASLTNGDGLLRRGPLLYVVRNRDNAIAKVVLGPGYRAGRVLGTITDPAFDVPTTVDAFGPFLYAVNARFGTTPTPSTTYTVVRLP